LWQVQASWQSTVAQLTKRNADQHRNRVSVYTMGPMHFSCVICLGRVCRVRVHLLRAVNCWVMRRHTLLYNHRHAADHGLLPGVAEASGWQPHSYPQRQLKLSGVEIFGVRGGEGPPVAQLENSRWDYKTPVVAVRSLILLLWCLGSQFDFLSLSDNAPCIASCHWDRKWRRRGPVFSSPR
jgi:hypothetical protein